MRAGRDAPGGLILISPANRRPSIVTIRPLRPSVYWGENPIFSGEAQATHHQVVTRQASNRLPARLGQNEETLRAVHRGSLVRLVTPHVAGACSCAG